MATPLTSAHHESMQQGVAVVLAASLARDIKAALELKLAADENPYCFGLNHAQEKAIAGAICKHLAPVKPADVWYVEMIVHECISVTVAGMPNPVPGTCWYPPFTQEQLFDIVKRLVLEGFPQCREGFPN